MASSELPPAAPRPVLLGGLVALAIAPYWFNDFLFIELVKGEPGWPVYLTDYLTRILGLAILLLLPPLRGLALAGEGRRLDWWFVLPFLGVAYGFHQLADIYILAPVNGAMPDFVLFQYPATGFDWLDVFDLTAGLLLVAVSEELLCRRVAFRYLERLGLGAPAVLLVSTLMFALMHWSGGLGALGYTFVLGGMLAGIYMWQRSLVLVIFLHYMINLIDFI